MTGLTNSSRRIQKATYVSIKLDGHASDPGRAMVKFGFVRHLNLQPGEVDMVRQTLSSTAHIRKDQRSKLRDHARLWDTLKAFEGSPLKVNMR